MNAYLCKDNENIGQVCADDTWASTVADKSITELTPAINTVCCWIKINNVRPKERHVILVGKEGLYITLLYEGQ